MNTVKTKSSHRTIKILKLLSEKPMSMNEIFNEFSDEDDFISKETISKYFSTLRQLGVVIQKNKNKFFLKYPICSINFSNQELSVLADFEKMAHDLCSSDDYKVFKSIYEKIFNLTNNECSNAYDDIKKSTFMCNGASLISQKHKEKIEKLADYLSFGSRKIKIKYDNTSYQIIPKYIKYMKSNVYLYAYDNISKVNKLFVIDKIEDISLMPQMAAGSEFAYATTFKIYKRLKFAYYPREGEIVEDFSDYQIVTNKDEDKDSLFRRLLRYVDLCEIIYPASDREKFKKLIDNMLANQCKKCAK